MFIGMMARKAGLLNIFVSNGYDTPETVAEMPKFLDCVTVDFKGSGETNFVRKYINIPNAEPIFQTLLDTRDTKKIHIEITDLIVPQVGDDLNAARKLSKWVYDNLGPDTPIHFLRFHPDYKMMEFPWTPVETLEKHCAVAKEEGLKYVYIGNVSGHPLEHTYCPGCGAVAIKRYGFDITGWYLDKDNKCKKCGYQLAIFGRLESTAKEDRYYSVLYQRRTSSRSSSGGPGRRAAASGGRCSRARSTRPVPSAGPSVASWRPSTSAPRRCIRSSACSRARSCTTSRASRRSRPFAVSSSDKLDRPGPRQRGRATWRRDSIVRSGRPAAMSTNATSSRPSKVRGSLTRGQAPRPWATS